MDQFTTAYLQCILFTELDGSDENTGGEPLEDNYSISDFSNEAQKKAIADCEKFQEENIDDIETIPNWKGYPDSSGRESYTNYECAGHDFWFTKNGHGVDFWSRNELTKEVRDRLTKASKLFGESHAYVGDDGLIYLE